MFDFIKKLKTVYEIPEPLGVRERALEVFLRIEGLDDIKEMMLRALESHERAHTLLIGPPASAKSLFMLELEKLCHLKYTSQKERLLRKQDYRNSFQKISTKKLSL
jgi:hypothetical protein